MGTYSPGWAKHVVGEYPDREPDGDGGFEPQLVKIACSSCGATHQVKCNSGNVRMHVVQFAKAHYHKDPFMPGRKT